MALPTSGNLSLNDIYTEATTNSSYSGARSLLDLIAFPGWSGGTSGFSSIRDFLGAEGTDVYGIWDSTGQDYQVGTLSSATTISSGTINMWLRIGDTTKRSFHMGGFGSTQNSVSDNTYIVYQQSLNRIATVAYRNSTAVQKQREFYLHDTNSSVTGITNFNTGWVTGQRGNVDADNFTMITFTYDLTNTTATSAMKLYWNGSEVIDSVNNTNNTTSTYNANYLSVGSPLYAALPNASSYKGDIMFWRAYNTQLSAANVSTLYNAGKVDAATAGVTSGLIVEIPFANSVEDTESLVSSFSGSTITFDGI